MLHAGALLLDMDGLMVDSEPLWFEVERAFARARGGEWTERHWHACIGRGLANTIAVMGETFGFPVDVERDGAELVDAFIARTGELSLKPGCAELLAEAFGRVPLALASSSNMRLVEATVSRLGIRERFGALVSGDMVNHPKPAPDIFLAAAQKLDVPAARCVVLEDSLAGATAGRAAGMRVIAVPERDAAAFAAIADVVATDLFEARRALSF